MRAAVGDHVVISSNEVDRPVRNGEIVGVRHDDGTPPYIVRWADTGRVGLLFPCVDARVEHHAGEPAEVQQPDRPVKTWRIQVDVYESGDETTAHAVLMQDAPAQLDSEGRARRHPRDPAVPLVGDELAVSRALRRLADQLVESASSDLAAVTHTEIRLPG